MFKKKSKTDIEYEELEKKFGKEEMNRLSVIGFFQHTIEQTPLFKDILKRLDVLEAKAKDEENQENLFCL